MTRVNYIDGVVSFTDVNVSFFATGYLFFCPEVMIL